jgi:hypothetical protein
LPDKIQSPGKIPKATAKVEDVYILPTMVRNVTLDNAAVKMKVS